MNKGLKTWIEKNKSPLTFVLKLLLSYLALQFIYDYIISPYTPLDFWLINSIIDSSEKLLEVMGYTLIESNLLYQYHMGIEGTSGVVIGNPCDGLSLFIFSIFNCLQRKVVVQINFHPWRNFTDSFFKCHSRSFLGINS